MAYLQDAGPDSDEAQNDIKEIHELNAATQGRKLTWKEFFTNGKEMNLWRFSVACASQAFQQMSGINLVTYYATTIFGESSLDLAR